MSKILAIADIHIHDYPQRNPSEKFRLYQGRIVAKNVIEAAKNSGATIVVIAGDILEKSIIRPYVQAEVKWFLDEIMSYFDIGYIIWGNHDQDNKGSDQDFTDSCLAVMLPRNLHYADKKEVVIDNARIAFSNWRPEFDLTWINGKVNVLFTHATISYTESDLFKSQYLDESKFDVAICGDIHKPGNLGKFVSIGTPQRCKMSDGDRSTGVIYDCISNTWDWVDLNTQNNLMKFEYTSDQTEEGWKADLGIWKVYKPASLGIIDGTRNIKIPAWEEINHLIDQIIIQNNLQDVHGEILKSIRSVESKEVDFNFMLTRFYCKNWRSIEEAELHFNDLDKILITGRNGSGKSSLLSALRYAFEENRFIKDFIQFGSKSCLTEVDFIYQESLYRVQRGSKKYGLWINGEPQKYNNKKEFEEDLRIRFPFIEYMDIYFFDSDHPKLIGGISAERKSEIVSKFFKMDKIDAYNEEAESLLTIATKDISIWKETIEKEKQLISYIESKLNLVQLPELSKDELVQAKLEGYDLQRKSKLWSDFQVLSAQLSGKLTNYQEDLAIYKTQLSNQREESIINQESAIALERVNNLNCSLSELSSLSVKLEQVKSQRKEIVQKGIRLHTEYTNLSATKICPTCNQTVSCQDTFETRKSELTEEMAAIKKSIAPIDLNIQNLTKQIEDSAIRRQNLQLELSELQKTQLNLREEINNIIELRRKISNLNTNIVQCQNDIMSLGKPEEVTLPDHFIDTLTTIESNISIWDTYDRLMKDKIDSEVKMNSANDNLTAILKNVDSLQKYVKITGPTGKIYEEIMTNLAKQFSDNQVKYEVLTYNFRKRDYLDLASFYYNKGNWVGYQACSDGQKTVLDVNFLSKVVTRMGLLIMDEFLKHLDPHNHDLCTEMISSMNIGCIMLSSHMESIASFNNKSCKLDLNDSGITKVTLE